MSQHSTTDKNWIPLCGAGGFDEWLQTARKLYAVLSGTELIFPRPRLFTPEDAAYIRDNLLPPHNNWDYATFVSMVTLLASDTEIDHTRFDTLPWRLGEVAGEVVDTEKWRTDEDELRAGKFRRKPESWSYYFFWLDWLKNNKPTPAHPNCTERCHLPVGFNVYNFASVLGHNHGGECWLSLDVTAKWSAVSRKTVRRHIEHLVATGWLIETQPPKDGPGGAGKYRVLRHEEWVKAHGTHECIQLADDGNSAECAVAE
jgi:hypothetical protein